MLLVLYIIVDPPDHDIGLENAASEVTTNNKIITVLFIIPIGGIL